MGVKSEILVCLLEICTKSGLPLVLMFYTGKKKVGRTLLHTLCLSGFKWFIPMAHNGFTHKIGLAPCTIMVHAWAVPLCGSFNQFWGTPSEMYTSWVYTFTLLSPIATCNGQTLQLAMGPTFFFWNIQHQQHSWLDRLASCTTAKPFLSRGTFRKSVGPDLTYFGGTSFCQWAHVLQHPKGLCILWL